MLTFMNLFQFNLYAQLYSILSGTWIIWFVWHHLQIIPNPKCYEVNMSIRILFQLPCTYHSSAYQVSTIPSRYQVSTIPSSYQVSTIPSRHQVSTIQDIKIPPYPQDSQVIQHCNSSSTFSAIVTSIHIHRKVVIPLVKYF